MKTPLISIILLTYNNFSHIKPTVESIFIQNYPHLELLISDDNSSHFPISIIENIIQSHSPLSNFHRVKVFSNSKNLGTVRHANQVAKVSSGDFIKFLGADDEFIDQNVISDSVLFMQKTGCLVSTSQTMVFDPSSKKQYIFPSKKKVDLINSTSPIDLFGKLVVYGNIIGAPGVMFHRRFFTEYGGFNEDYKYTEDYPTWLKLLRNSIQIPCMDRVTVKYRQIGVSAKENQDSIIGKSLKNELSQIIQNEILPHENLLTNFQKRYARFVFERTKSDNKTSFFKKLVFFIKNLDIVIFRRFSTWGKKYF